MYEVLKIRDFNKLLRLLFATPQQLLRDPLWGRDQPVGNHCSKPSLDMFPRERTYSMRK